MACAVVCIESGILIGWMRKVAAGAPTRLRISSKQIEIRKAIAENDIGGAALGNKQIGADKTPL